MNRHRYDATWGWTKLLFGYVVKKQLSQVVCDIGLFVKLECLNQVFDTASVAKRANQLINVGLVIQAVSAYVIA